MLKKSAWFEVFLQQKSSNKSKTSVNSRMIPKNLNWCRSYWEDLTHRVVEMSPWKPVFCYIGYSGGFLPVIVLPLEGYHWNVFYQNLWGKGNFTPTPPVSISPYHRLTCSSSPLVPPSAFSMPLKCLGLKRPGKGDHQKSIVPRLFWGGGVLYLN